MKQLFYNLLVGLFGLLLCTTSSYGQRRMENLDRGTVVVPVTGGVMVNWRITGPEYAANAKYNLYRGSSLIASGLDVSNYLDAAANGEGYTVAAVINGVEEARSETVASLAKQYFTIPVRAINGSYSAYEINDASVGDLDGDGEYEIVVKRLSIDATPTATTYHYLEAYKLDGTFMWAIDLGPNMINKVEINFLVYDLDGDGKAEVATRTSDGFTDGAGNYIGDRDGDGKISYRSTAVLNSSYYRIDGPDYISIFEGATGKEIAWNWYIDREPMSQWGTSGMTDGQLAHRAEKCMWSVAYLDGVNPSFIITRGIYHRIKLEAWNFNNGSLTKKWAFDSDPNGVATAYTGSGDHNFIVGDVDGDGRDEIMYGSMAVDEYGKGMYSTGFGHGDAQHLADINPDIAGLEHFSCLEGANGSTVPGLLLRNATTGAKQWSLSISGDIGRCMTADIDSNYYGMEIWGSDGSGIHSATGTLISSTYPMSTSGAVTYNAGVWWDGDVQRELLDRKVISKWNSTTKGTDRVATLYNLAAVTDNNDSKSNPCLMADILGDWREEVIYRLSDNTGMVVFVTPYTTKQKMYTLMHDKNYRTAISWQQNSYNQPPNLSFYFGGGMSTPPAPNITIVEKTSISLTAPADKASSRVGETVTLTADAHASEGTASVTFYATDKSTMTMTALGTDATAPYSLDWTPLTEGTYYIVAKVTDGLGKIVASNIITYFVTASAPLRFIYEYDGSGNMAWENTNSWTPTRLPTGIDTAVIRTGEVQVSKAIASPVIVEPNGIFRSMGNYTVAKVTLQGGALKVNTSDATYGIGAPVYVESASSLISGPNPVTIFNADLVFTGGGDLTKASLGTLELQKSSPSYSGNWFVEAGKMTLDAAHAVGSGNVVVADTASLVLNATGGLAGCGSLILQAGAALTLNAATDTVTSLKLGDSVVAAGNYSANDFPAFMAGTGSIVVLSGSIAGLPIAVRPHNVSGLRVYPIMAKDQITIEGEKSAQYFLFNANGALVKKLFVGTNYIAGVSPGIYYVTGKINSKYIGIREVIILK